MLMAVVTMSIMGILFGLGLAAFMPAQQAYISDQVTYLKRGRALGTVEFSWGLVGVVILTVIGWLIALFGHILASRSLSEMRWWAHWKWPAIK